MKLVGVRIGIKGTWNSSDNEMGSLYSVINHSSFILEVIKPEILKDIQNGQFTEYTYITAGIKVLDKDYFLLFDPYEFYDQPVDKEETYLKVPQKAFWKLLEEYDKVENTDWKKIEITFDGKEFDLQVEY